MTLTAPTDELDLLVRAQYGLLVLDTPEMDRAVEVARTVASRLSLRCFQWTRSTGLALAGGDERGRDGTAEPAAALREILREGAAIHVFRGLERHLEDPLVVSLLHDVAAAFARRRGALLIAGAEITLPDELRLQAGTVRVPGATYDEYRQLVESVVRDASVRMPVRVELDPAGRARLVKNLAGLPVAEARRVVRRLVVEDGRLSEDDVARAIAAKREAVERGGLLEFCEAAGAAPVGGLAGLKRWLEVRRRVVADPERAAASGLPFPKGVLLVGVPGCGKSLCARAVAREWGLPLLRLDPANLYNKFVGDTEKNFKQALAAAERLAPAVLWVDELEKVFANDGEDGGVSRRVLGGFLSWLQERNGDVFVVATANDVSTLPPEFVRKGRFDEVFFVDLPTAAARREVLAIHLRQRRQAPEHFDLDALAAATDGFSGAELEQIVVTALYGAFGAGAALGTAGLLAEARATRPLARLMPERVEQLRAWGRTRAVAAD